VVAPDFSVEILFLFNSMVYMVILLINGHKIFIDNTNRLPYTLILDISFRYASRITHYASRTTRHALRVTRHEKERNFYGK